MAALRIQDVWINVGNVYEACSFIFQGNRVEAERDPNSNISPPPLANTASMAALSSSWSSVPSHR